MDDQGLIQDPDEFRREHETVKKLAAGGEGKVTLWKNRSTGRLIAVKEPVVDVSIIRRALRTEVENMTKLGSHPHIVRFLGSANDWLKNSPAIFYEFCELGDVSDYTYKLLRSGCWIPEFTLWKFLIDMTKGLDYLHNRLDVPYVHGDLKPGNILVSRPHGDYTGVPLMPTFKLADISHLTPYDKNTSSYSMFAGTWEYGPPANEREKQLAPPVDIWAIGASLQTLAWGITPVKSNATIKKELRAVGHLGTDEEVKEVRNDNDYRRKGLPFVWRPMNAASIDQLTRFDMEYACPPYSNALNHWYAMCLDHNPEARITSRILMENLVPLAEEQMKLLVAKRRRDEALRKVKHLKSKALDRRNRELALAGVSQNQEPAATHGLTRKPVAKDRDLAQADAKETKETSTDDGKVKKKSDLGDRKGKKVDLDNGNGRKKTDANDRNGKKKFSRF